MNDHHKAGIEHGDDFCAEILVLMWAELRGIDFVAGCRSEKV